MITLDHIYILIGVLLILPMVGAQFGLDLSVVSQVVAVVTNQVIAVDAGFSLT